MKKIIFIGQFPPPHHGVSQMNEYALAVLEVKNKVRVINLSFSEKISEIRKISFFKIYKTLNALWRVLFECLTYRPDVCYFTLCPTGVALFRDFVFVVVLKTLNLKILYHIHGQGVRKNAKNKIYKLIYSFIFNDTKVIHLSEVFYNEVDEFVKRENFFVINNCIKVPSGIKRCRNSGPTSFTFLSNLMLDKGFLNFLEAVSILNSKGYDFSVNLVGDFFDENSKCAYEKWVSENLNFVNSGNFIYKSAQYSEDKFQILADGDVFVFPSNIDTYPLVLIEAMSMRMACISCKVGAIDEILDFGNAGITVQPNSIVELSDAMEFLLKDQSVIDHLKLKAKNKFENEFTYSKFSKKLESIVAGI